VALPDVLAAIFEGQRLQKKLTWLAGADAKGFAVVSPISKQAGE
jgi:hypothetical protein